MTTTLSDVVKESMEGRAVLNGRLYALSEYDVIYDDDKSSSTYDTYVHIYTLVPLEDS